MRSFFNKISIGFILTIILFPALLKAREKEENCPLRSQSVIQEKCPRNGWFDLKGAGRDEDFKRIELPFPYFQRQENDQFNIIHQGGYRVYHIAKSLNNVAVIGPSRPCSSIVVTDCTQAITFHKHSLNALASMINIIKANLNLSNPANLFAGIYSSKDDEEWQRNKRQQMHGGLTHFQAIGEIKSRLCALGFPPNNILAKLYDLRKPNGHSKFTAEYLGYYSHIELFVAVRLNDLFKQDNGYKSIKFTSIDPYTEDYLANKKGVVRVLEVKEILPNLTPFLNNIKGPFVAYDDLLKILGKLIQDIQIGHKIHCLISYKRFYAEENRLILLHFGRELKHIVAELQWRRLKYWDAIEFYPINATVSRRGIFIEQSKL